VPKIKRTTFFG